MLEVKSWFISKMENDYERRALSSGATYTVIAETEKAYKLNATTKFGTIVFWCPKSVTIEESWEEQEARKEAEAIQWEKEMNEGLAYNQMLKEFALNNGVKGIRKSNMRTATIIEKIKEAGLEVPARA